MPATARKSAAGREHGAPTNDAGTVTIAAPNLPVLAIPIVGVAPMVQNKFSKKAREQMRATQAAGSTAKTKRKRDPKDFDTCYEEAKHVSEDGWLGIPAPAFRAAMISACRVAGFTMTRAKLSIVVLADGFDSDDGTPLVRITKGKPFKHEAMVRVANGTPDIRARPMWREGWEATVRVRYDAEQFTELDVINLMLRAGMQVGIGEGRPDSKGTSSMGWGLFEIKEAR